MEDAMEGKKDNLSIDNPSFTISRPDSDVSAVDSNLMNNCDEGVEMLFDMCRTENGKISVKLFMEELSKFGIRKTDPRLENMMKLLNMYSTTSIEELNLDTQVFRNIVTENYVLINKIILNSFIIPNFDYFSEATTSQFRVKLYIVFIQSMTHPSCP